jgi:HEPN domain-containing protein
MKRETARWARKAEADLEGAQDLAQAARPHHDLICFHCQQSAEKYRKAFLIERGLSFPRTHRLEDLLLLVLPHDASLQKLRRTLVTLTRFAVDYRYPDENATKREAAAALRQATKVREQIRRRLGLPP